MKNLSLEESASIKKIQAEIAEAENNYLEVCHKRVVLEAKYLHVMKEYYANETIKLRNEHQTAYLEVLEARYKVSKLKLKLRHATEGIFYIGKEDKQ